MNRFKIRRVTVKRRSTTELGKLSPRAINIGPLPADTHLAILITRWNRQITDKLFAGTLRALKDHGLTRQQISLAQVPGAFELPLAAQRLAATDRYRAIIALGCIIRGDTPHFEYVAAACTQGLMSAQLKTAVPIAFGVLTTENLEQALARAAEGPDNKGTEAALTALEMVALLGGADFQP
ncbi:MAG: 6,7-dimethyl-8-ribityllumazine synthase [Cellvibrionales bacterium]|nr:6,7-dimethyl-8-ribityllumazine synthase [Cellvibrionales bacterium]